MKQLSIKYIAYLAVVALLAACATEGEQSATESASSEEQRTYLYNIDCTDLDVTYCEVQKGETAGKIFNRYGISAAQIDRIDRECREIFDLRKIRVGGKYAIFQHGDSTSRKLDYFVYEKSLTEYFTIAFCGDTISYTLGQKEIRNERMQHTATISSSLWNSIADAGMPISLAVDIEDIYGWSVDFFALQQGDSFTVIYDKQYVDTTCIGSGRVWGAIFTHGGKQYYAIPFKQGDKITYWDENGKSLRKLLLKAPLKYSRISSKFSNARLHPIYKVYRPHHGVDYAAPAGTPVYAIADGVVTFKGWSGGGGNTLKIKHPQNLMSGYLHLRGYAKGIAPGVRVSQGQLIGYVGSTGSSTGPHLDFRLWKGGTPIDPLKAPSEPVEPISEENMERFSVVRHQVLSELGDSLVGAPLMQLDSIILN